MGYYAERKDKANKNKAQGIAADHGGTHTDSITEAYKAFVNGKGVLCVVDNPGFGFEAAGLVINAREWLRFHQPDDLRPRSYVILERAVAYDICGYKED